MTSALRFGVVHERNAFLRSMLQGIASGDFIALAMTSQESHCESAVADAAVSVHITHKSTEFLGRSESDVPARCSATARKRGNPIKDCFTLFAMTLLLSTYINRPFFSPSLSNI